MADYEDACTRCDVYDFIRSGAHCTIDCAALQRALRLGLEALPILRALRGAAWAALPLDKLRGLLLASISSEPSLTDALLELALPGRFEDPSAIAALLDEVVAAVRRTKRLTDTVIAKASKYAGAPGLELWRGLDAGDVDADGRTALHRAVMRGDSSGMAALAAAVDACLADPSPSAIAPLAARTSRGYRCLDLACAVGNLDAVELLLRLCTAATAADSGLSASVKTALLDASEPSAEIHETLPGWTAVHLAARGGHARIIMRFLKELPHFQAAAKPGVLADGSTLLHIAVTHHHPRLALALLDLHPEWTWAETAEGSLPIHLAAQHGVSPALFEAITKVMVAWQMMGAEGGASPPEVGACAAEMDVAVAAAAADLNDLRDGQGCNVAMLAAQFGKRSLLAWLLGQCHCATCRGSDPVDDDDVGSGAAAAASAASPAASGSTRDLFACALPVEDDGLPQLQPSWACTAASSPLIDGHAANSKGWTPFLMACKSGMNACVRTLAPGVDFTATQVNGYNALMLGAMADKVDAIIDVARDAGKALPQLLSHTANDGMRAVHVAAAYGKPAALAAICKEMVAGPLPADASGMTPLHHAAQCGSAECVRAVIAHYAGSGDADALRLAANAADGEGWPPMTLAAQNGHAEVVKLLIAAGADPNKPLPGGTTPLTMACQQRHAQVVTLLAPHAVGTIPASIALFMSVVDEETHCCRALIAAGVDVNAQSPTGSTALLETKESGAYAQAAMLLQAGVDVRASALAASDADLFAAASGRSGDDAAARATRSLAKKPLWGATGAAADDGDLWPSHRGFINPAAAAAYYGHDDVLSTFILDKGCTPRALLTAVDDYGGSPLGWLAARGFRQLAARRAAVCGFAKADYDPLACACQPVSQFLSDAHLRSVTLPAQLRAAAAAMQADEARTPFWSPALLLAAFHGFPAAAVSALAALQAASHGFGLDPNARFPAGMSLVPFYNSEVVLEESLSLSPVEAATLQGYPDTVRALQAMDTWIPAAALAAVTKTEPVVSPLLAEASAAIRAFLLDAEGGSMSFAFVPIPHIVPSAVKLGVTIGRGAFGTVHLSHYDGFRQPKRASGGSGASASGTTAATGAASQEYPVAVKMQTVDVKDAASRERLWREIATQLLCTYVRWAPTGPEPVHKKQSALLGFNVVTSDVADAAAPSATAMIMLRRREGTLRALLSAAGSLLKSAPAADVCPSGIPPALVVSAAWQLTQSLGQLHWRDRPLMHADLKSDNCLWYISDAASEDAVLLSVGAAARPSLEAIVAAASTAAVGSLPADATIAVELCDYGLSSLEADSGSAPCRRYLRTLPPEVRNRTGRYTTQGDVFCLALIFVELVLGGKLDAARIEQLGAAALAVATKPAAAAATHDASSSAPGGYQSLAAGAAATPAAVDTATILAATYSSLDAGSAAAATAYEPLTTAGSSAQSIAFSAGLAALREVMCSHVPARLAELVVLCLAQEPDARPTLREVHDGLLQVLQAASAGSAAGSTGASSTGGAAATLAEFAAAIRAAQQAAVAVAGSAAALEPALDAAVAACDTACALAAVSFTVDIDGMDESAEQPSHQCAAAAAWPACDWLGSAVTLLRLGTTAIHREHGYRVLAQLLSGEDELPAALCWRAGIVPLMCAERVHLAEAAYVLGKVIDLAAIAPDTVKAALPGMLAALTAALQSSGGAAPANDDDDDDSEAMPLVFGAAQLVMGLSLVPVLFSDASVTPSIAALGTALLAAAGDTSDLPWSQLGVLLWAAVDTRQAALVDALAAKGVESPLNADGTSALHLAVAKGLVPIVEALCKAQPDLVSAPDQAFRTPLHTAAATGNTACGEALLAAGADVAAVTSGQGRTPLHELCARVLEDDAAVVLLGSALVAAGAKVNAGDATGNTPLHLAVASGNSIAVQLLLARGADKTKANRQGVSAKTAANRAYLATGDPTIYALLQ